MAKSRGSYPDDFDGLNGEILDFRVIVDLASAVDQDLEEGRDPDEIIDGLYKFGFSPEAVDRIMQTSELNEGSTN